jgi:short-subunit dehydrogenase
MKTLIIIGAGPGLGLSLAKRFGERGFQVALVARSGARLDALANELDGLGIAGRGFVADVLDGERLGVVLLYERRDRFEVKVGDFTERLISS